MEAKGRDRAEKGDKGEKGEDREFRRRRFRPAVDLVFDYKDTDGLKQFLAEGGKIVPARVSRLSRKQQRKLTTAVKRARQLALLPISDRHENL
ncbi:MAG: 30S ribosomal protein S18 [Bdellovibrionales bacterium]|nr:30S ribosomal protein S18 [Bdellovibrionales bacterium]